jgi:hypothetical protein
MEKQFDQTCLKSGLPLANPAICQMCKRSCRKAGARRKSARHSASGWSRPKQIIH